jgi:hypothetical protein
MVPLVKTLENNLLPSFENLTKRLNEMSHVQANVFSYPAGSLTEFQAHVIGVSCLLSKPETESDNVALSVEVAYLTTVPRICADVCWGHPYGHVEEEWGWGDRETSKEWNVVTDEVLKDLYSNIPRLCEALIESVNRRPPSSDE